MHYTAAVLEAFLDAYGPDAVDTAKGLRAMLQPRKCTGSLLESWFKFRDIAIADVGAALFPAILRFHCAGGHFSPQDSDVLSNAVMEFMDQLRYDSSGLPTPGHYYPTRENYAVSILGRELGGSSDLCDSVLEYLRGRSRSPYEVEKFRRRALDSDAGRASRYLCAWLSSCELELRRGMP
jgi:hypothetical protein